MDSEPFAKVGDFASLTVVAVESIGAFLDNGVPKDLFLPFREQTRPVRTGDRVVVYVRLDSSGRECASMRTNQHIDLATDHYRDGDRVDLLVAERTDLGFRVIVDNRHSGMVYASEVFQPLRLGQRLDGYVAKVREDGKLDLRLTRTGHKDAEPIGERILDALEDGGGFLPVTDKTDPDEIYRRFGVSKKKFKMAVGGLLKKGAIALGEDGLRRL